MIRHAILFVTGIFIFPAAFVLQRVLWTKTKLGRSIARKYSFNDKDIADISNKIVSGFQAVLAAAAGFLVFFGCKHDVIHASHHATVDYAWLGIPYFIYDTFCMFYVDRIKKGPAPNQPMYRTFLDFFRFIIRTPVIVIHHIVMAPIGFSLIVFYRNPNETADFFVGIIYLMETSTPFVCLRFILSKLKMKSSPLYAINGVFMLLSFPVFRIASVFYAWFLYSQQLNVGCIQSFLEAPTLWKTCFVLALVPQVYWYYLMVKGLIKMLKPPTDVKSSIQNEKKVD